MKLLYAKTLQEARHAKSEGYEPIECCFGEVSVVGKYCLDHHGPYADQEPVSLRAHDIVHQRGFQPLEKIVVTGRPDADTSYAALLLTGNLSPSLPIARAIGQLDLDPVGIAQTQGDYLRVAAYRTQLQPKRTKKSHVQALAIGTNVFSSEPLSRSTATEARQYERQRARRAKQAIQYVEDGIALVHSDEDSRDIWHKIFASLVIQYKPAEHILTFSGCTRDAVRRLRLQGIQRKSVYRLLGDQGFLGCYASFDAFLGEGSGGRADIGGSPKHLKITPDQAFDAYCHLQKLAAPLSQRPRKAAS